MNERLILMTKRLFRDLGSRQRPGVRRSSGAFERLVACGKLQRAGALIRFAHPAGSLRLSISAALRFQNALALMMIATVVMASRPAQAQWEPLPPLPEPNGGFVCGIKDGKIVVRGGTNWTGGKKNWLKKVHEFDPVQKTWELAAERSEPEAYAVVFQYDGRFVLGGGYNGERGVSSGSMKHGVLSAGGLVNGAMILVGGTDDPANLAGVSKETWRLSKGNYRKADYPGKPFATAASAVAGSELFVFGGMNYDAEAKLPANTAEAYAFSPEKNVWRKLKPLAAPTRGLTAVTLDESHIYIAGGYREDFTAEAVIYDVKADSYRKALPLPYAAMVGLVKMGDHVYCLGGEDKKQSRTDKFFRIPVAELLE
jgi:N-acetylneuraminic acid mutarotase